MINAVAEACARYDHRDRITEDGTTNPDLGMYRKGAYLTRVSKDG